MRSAEISIHNRPAGILKEMEKGRRYCFEYFADYVGPPISLTMPVAQQCYEFDRFPPFFEGLLPEGFNLEALLKTAKIDHNDLLGQLIAVGADMVGAVTARVIE
jgi:serine/threonine-protein kinase HipA